MKDNKENLNESLQKISRLMYYDSTKTAFENEDLNENKKLNKDIEFIYVEEILNNEIIEEQFPGNMMAGSLARRAMRKITIKNLNPYLRKIHRNVVRLNDVISNLEGKTYNGEPAIDAVKTAYKERYNEDLPIPGVSTEQPSQPKATDGYKPCPSGVNQFGCKSDMIGKVQSMLGVTVDNRFGPKTQNALSKFAPEFSKQFTDDDYSTIRNKIIGVRKGTSVKMQPDMNKVNPDRKTVKTPTQTKTPTSKPLNLKPSGKYNSLAGNKTGLAKGKTGFQNPLQANEKPTNMTQGFVNESHQEQIRDPKILKKIEREKRAEERKNKRQRNP